MYNISIKQKQDCPDYPDVVHWKVMNNSIHETNSKPIRQLYKYSLSLGNWLLDIAKLLLVVA